MFLGYKMSRLSLSAGHDRSSGNKSKKGKELNIL